jgi:membrane protein implicated in regulation of membrane protease activity
MDSEVWRWIWLAAAAACAVGELAVPGTIVVLSLAQGAALAAFLDAALALQWALFVGGSGLALGVLIPVGRRLAHAEGDEVHEGATRWVGRVAIVLEEIPAGPDATGKVRVERDEWRAQTEAAEAIPVGTEVEVLGVRGTRLIVTRTETGR